MSLLALSEEYTFLGVLEYRRIYTWKQAELFEMNSFLIIDILSSRQQDADISREILDTFELELIRGN